MNSSKLIDNVRKIQRSRAGGLKFRPIDLCEILTDLKDHYSNVPDREVDIRLTGLRQCFVSTNELIRDVFTNLISNSIKHSSPDRRLEITIDLKKITRRGKDLYEISIEDNGPGIPDNLKSRLFTRFERGKTKASGRGLGLYLVKTLLEDMGGSISAEDRVKGDHRKGARFVVLLPAISNAKRSGI
jgi:signal transduction histidine kinase